MGSRYLLFRARYELGRRSGLLKRRFPTEPAVREYISLAEWKALPTRFFFAGRSQLRPPKRLTPALTQKIERLRRGEFPYFNAAYHPIGRDYDWLTNPDSGYRYDPATHWVDVEDLRAEAGDIKYVWEKSRFAHLLTIVRYDYHSGEDCSAWVFGEIDDWIRANPINRGPNYKCSQEISLRLLNWLWVLYYYRDSEALTEARFQRIMHVCYWQLHHVYQNIQFSRIAVRNNHAITETLMLYLGGLFFPFFPEADRWSRKGLHWLEEEVAYQVYPDGTFLQFSHNYHRVLIQLLTWTLYLSRLNGRSLSARFIHRSQQSFRYLYQCQLSENGYLPNYGANDGALFFPLNDCHYRDYRPQLNALAYFFTGTDLYADGPWTEDRQWYANTPMPPPELPPLAPRRSAARAFPDGGYLTVRDATTLTFMRCGSHKDRPSHADNLHLDIWVDGVNLLRDAGTYKYNTDADILAYFIGTKGHNTVMLGPHDQMRKGARFIWFDWTQAESMSLTEGEDRYTLRGTIQAFGHLDDAIRHEREVIKYAGQMCWRVQDTVRHATELPVRQVWNLHPDFDDYLTIQAVDEAGAPLSPTRTTHWYSSEYGSKMAAPAVIFSTFTAGITTTITAR